MSAVKEKIAQAEYADLHLTPTLTKALLAMCRAKPKDPITFLAQQLQALKPPPPQEPVPVVEGYSATDMLDVDNITPPDVRAKALACVQALLTFKKAGTPPDADIDGAAKAVAANLPKLEPDCEGFVLANLKAVQPVSAWLPALEALVARLDEKRDGWKFASDGTSFAPTLLPGEELQLDGAAQAAFRRLHFIDRAPHFSDQHVIKRMRLQAFKGSRKSERPFAVVMAGPAGAGKSFSRDKLLPWLHKEHGLPAPEHYAMIDPDIWITELCGNNNALRPIANYCNHETFLAAVRERRHMIFDATGRQLLNTCGRIIGRLERANYQVVMCSVLSKRDTCWQRIESRRIATGRGVPGFIFNPTFDDMRTVVPVYLRGVASGLCTMSILSNNEPDSEAKLGLQQRYVLTSESSKEEIDATVAAAHVLLETHPPSEDGEEAPKKPRPQTAPPPAVPK